MSNNEFSSVEWLYNKMVIKLCNKLQTIEYTHIFLEELEKAKAMHKEEIIQTYSNGWHDGQDVIIMRIEHIDKGGDERGLKYYEQPK